MHLGEQQASSQKLSALNQGPLMDISFILPEQCAIGQARCMLEQWQVDRQAGLETQSQIYKSVIKSNLLILDNL
jgi:hypothetical protein